MSWFSEGKGPFGLFGIEGQMAMADGDLTAAYTAEEQADATDQATTPDGKQNRLSWKAKAGVILGGIALVAGGVKTFIWLQDEHNNAIQQRVDTTTYHFNDVGLHPDKVIARAGPLSTHIEETIAVFTTEDGCVLSLDVDYDGLTMRPENKIDGKPLKPQTEPANPKGLEAQEEHWCVDNNG